MPTHIALFRGINVGGTGKLPSKALVSLLEDLGAEEVRTYIQSGNAVFRHATRAAAGRSLARTIERAVLDAHGFEPAVLVLTPARLAQAAAGNPFPEGEEEPSKLHLSFLAETPQAPNRDKLEALRAGRERFALVEDVFYLHAPDGVARSKLAAGAERALGVAATARNWRTVQKILALAD